MTCSIRVILPDYYQLVDNDHPLSTSSLHGPLSHAFPCCDLHRAHTLHCLNTRSLSKRALLALFEQSVSIVDCVRAENVQNLCISGFRRVLPEEYLAPKATMCLKLRKESLEAIGELAEASDSGVTEGGPSDL